jgi:hypothetical protein
MHVPKFLPLQRLSQDICLHHISWEIAQIYLSRILIKKYFASICFVRFVDDTLPFFLSDSELMVS